jgi:hypothetical protein
MSGRSAPFKAVIARAATALGKLHFLQRTVILSEFCELLDRKLVKFVAAFWSPENTAWFNPNTAHDLFAIVHFDNREVLTFGSLECICHKCSLQYPWGEITRGNLAAHQPLVA